MGALSLPVKNFKKRRCSSGLSSCTISHNHVTHCEKGGQDLGVCVWGFEGGEDVGGWGKCVRGGI